MYIHAWCSRRVVVTVATLCAGAAFGVALAWKAIFEAILISQIALTSTSRSFRDWLAPTVPLYFNVYFFNWTNAEKFPEEIPNFMQLGPYRFREYRRHVNVSWHPNNSSVAYRTHRTWHFDPTSNGTLQDTITTFNLVTAAAVYRLRNSPSFHSVLSLILTISDHKLYVSKTVDELLLQGYEDTLLFVSSYLPADIYGGAAPQDRIGLFYGRNNTWETDGYVETSTGTESGTFPGQIRRWNHLDHLPFYEGECSKLAGSMGEFLPRDLTQESHLSIFMPDLCRTLHLEYEASGELGSLPYHKYGLTETGFDTSSSTSRNSCFCSGECGFRGVMNVSTCQFNSPSFISLPHFLHSDPRHRELVNGMHPDPEKHSLYFKVEPTFGIPLDVKARFQFNLAIEPYPDIRVAAGPGFTRVDIYIYFAANHQQSTYPDDAPVRGETRVGAATLFENLPKMLFPILWVEQSVKVEHHVLSELRIGRAFLDYGGSVCAFVAFVFTGLLTLLICCSRIPQ